MIRDLLNVPRPEPDAASIVREGWTNAGRVRLSLCARQDGGRGIGAEHGRDVSDDTELRIRAALKRKEGAVRAAPAPVLIAASELLES